MKYVLEIDTQLWRRFLAICKRLGTNGAVKLRELIINFLQENENRF